MAIRAAFTLGIELAGADRLMILNKISHHHAAAEQLCASAIRTLEGVTDVTHANWFGGYYQETKNAFANMAVDAESWLRMYPEFAVAGGSEEGVARRPHGRDRRASTRRRRFGWKVGDRVPLQATIYRRPDGTAWEFNDRRHLRLAREGHRQDAALLPLGLPERDGPRQDRLRATRSAGTSSRSTTRDQSDRDREEDRRDVRELADRDEDRQREGVRRGLRRNRSATSA